MNGKLKQDLAALWQRILRTDATKLFGKHHKSIRDYNEDDWIAQPGYVGSQYRTRGLVFVAVNPGGQKREDIGFADSKQYKLLKKLRDAAPKFRVAAFENLNRDLVRSMKNWNIYRRYIPEILKGTDIGFSDVAYVNLVKWRTVGEGMPRAVVKISWEAHTREQLALLRPSLIVSLGKSIAGPFIDEFYNEEVHNITIPRTRRDLRLSDGSKAAIKLARTCLFRWIKRRE